MPARLVQVTILNNSRYPIVWQDDDPSCFWQDPWYQSTIKNLKKGVVTRGARALLGLSCRDLRPIEVVNSDDGAVGPLNAPGIAKIGGETVAAEDDFRTPC